MSVVFDPKIHHCPEPIRPYTLVDVVRQGIAGEKSLVAPADQLFVLRTKSNNFIVRARTHEEGVEKILESYLGDPGAEFDRGEDHSRQRIEDSLSGAVELYS
jgi:hypothetical protein